MAAEGFQPREAYTYKYEANFDTDRLVVLKTVGDIAAFSNQYAIPGKNYPFVSIDWNKVKKDTGKSGIYIVNGSLKTARKKFPWYSTFDACSVAIWDTNAIVSMVETPL
jgi:hypothetical protein